jgi:hypothetical protein
MGGIVLPAAINVANKGSIGPTLIHGETSHNKIFSFLCRQEMGDPAILNYSLTEISADLKGAEKVPSVITSSFLWKRNLPHTCWEETHIVYWFLLSHE